MKLTNCKNCGAALYNNHCLYCGSDYSFDNSLMTPIIIREARAKVIQAQSIASREAVENLPDFMDYIYKDLAKKLAEYIINNDCMEVIDSYDLNYNTVTFKARTRIIPNNITL